MNRYQQILFAILLSTLLLGCTPVKVTPTAPATAAAPIQVTRQTPTATAPSSTLTPTTTQPLPTETSTPAATATVRPSLTPRPSATPLPSATPRPTHYDLPAWLSDPNAVVLFAWTAADYPLDVHVLTFNNLSTGERFDTPPFGSQPLSAYWYQDETGTYIEQSREGDILNPNPPIEQINIATGELRVLPPLPLDGSTDWSIPAPGGRYAVRILNDPAPQTVTMEDQETGEMIILSDPFNGRYSGWTQAIWSPAGDFLAVLRYAFAEPFARPGTGIVIYRPDGTIFRWYDDFYSAMWAPDNSYRILYQIGEEFGAYQPCILDVLTGTSDCFTEVATWGEGQATGMYEWLPSGQGISFVAWAYSSSALCILTVENRQISCPIDNTLIAPAKFTADDPTFIIDYGWSPDGRYLWLVINPSSPWGDEAIYAKIATVAADGSQFQVLGFGSAIGWRPDLNP